MNFKNLNKILIFFALAVFLFFSCSTTKHRKKKKCNDCPSFSYNIQTENDRN